MDPLLNAMPTVSGSWNEHIVDVGAGRRCAKLAEFSKLWDRCYLYQCK